MAGPFILIEDLSNIASAVGKDSVPVILMVPVTPFPNWPPDKSTSCKFTIVATFLGPIVPAMVDDPATSKVKAPSIRPVTPVDTIKSPSIPEFAVKVSVFIPPVVKLK